MSVHFSSIPQKRLTFAITSASTTFYVNNILSFDGENNVTPADLGTQHYCAFRNDTGTILELMEIDPATISAGPITILRRGLSFYGNRTTETTALKLDWSANSIVMLGSDIPQIFQYLKEYIDAAAIAGSVPASTSAAGIVVEASQAEVDARTVTKTIVGVPYKLFAPLDKIRVSQYYNYAADAGSTDAYAITVVPAITAYATGQVFVFKANTINTGVCTLNVNSLGAKTIKKDFNIDLADGDIKANQLIEVVYDGTNFQMFSPVFLTDVQTFTSSGTWTKPSGTPKAVEVIVIGAGGNGGNGFGANAGTNRGGSSGGGGGTPIRKIFPAGALGATETVTVGASAGASSVFGSFITSIGGGGGDNGSVVMTAGGAGAGLVGRAGGSASGTSLEGAGSATAGSDGRSAAYGGASGGGGVYVASGAAGGSSLFGGGAGGGGGGVSNDTPAIEYAGGQAGVSLSYVVGGGQAGGAVRTAGSAGTSRSGTGNCGDGGSGGGGTNNGTGGAGGAGGAPGGGGGGGGAGTSTGGAGGAGGRGEVIVITYF